MLFRSTWFADDGGPADGALSLTVTVLEPDPEEDTDKSSEDTGEEGTEAPLPGQAVPLSELGSCGCNGGGGGGASLGLIMLYFRRQRKTG